MKLNLPSSFETCESSREDVTPSPMREQYLIKLFEAIDKMPGGWVLKLWIRFSVSLKQTWKNW